MVKLLLYNENIAEIDGLRDVAMAINFQIKSNLFVTQNYTITVKDGKIEQCVNTTQRQLRATLTGAQTDIYGKS